MDTDERERRRAAARRERRRQRRRRFALAVMALAVAGSAASYVVVHSQPAASDQPAAASRHAQLHRLQARRGWVRHPGPVPILMYHRLEPHTPADTPAVLNVAPRRFTAQMHALRRAGYRPVTMHEVQRAWNDGGLLPRKPIVLTFDDGYRSQYAVAFRTLARMHWRGVLNLVPSNAAVASGVTRPEVRRMLAGGWELGSHTIHHRDLRRMSGRQLRAEVAGSRTLLERQYDVRVDTFCYPAGAYDHATVDAVRRAGYATATTVSPGLAARSQPFDLDRIRVDGAMKPRTLLDTVAKARVD